MGTIFDFARRPFQPEKMLDEADVGAFERTIAVRLPEDYRAFLLTCNGGSLMPGAFDLVVPGFEFDEKVHALDYLYDLQEVAKRSQLRFEPALRNIPPGRLAIGCTVSQLTLTLAIADDRFGAIEAWVRDTFNVWGEGANKTLVPLAASFAEFLRLLHDSPEVYMPFWAGFGQDGETASKYSPP